MPRLPKGHDLAEGLDFGMVPSARYRAAMQAQGFADIRLTLRKGGCGPEAQAKVARMKSSVRVRAAALVGADFVAHHRTIWERMFPVPDTGEHCPTHLAARRP